MKSQVHQDTVLVSKLNPEIERVWLVDVKAGERAICSTEFIVLQGRRPFRRNYIYCLARSRTFRQEIQTLVTGTSKSHQRAQADAILSLQVVISSANVVESFELLTSPFLSRTLLNLREVSKLTALRDTLLPKLISGEVRLKQAELPLAGVK